MVRNINLVQVKNLAVPSPEILYTKFNIYKTDHQLNVAKSAGAVEYTDYFSTEE